MAKCKPVMLKHSEIEYLLDVCTWTKEDGLYRGRKDYFEKIQEKVIAKLQIAANTKAPER